VKNRLNENATNFTTVLLLCILIATMQGCKKTVPNTPIPLGKNADSSAITADKPFINDNNEIDNKTSTTVPPPTKPSNETVVSKEILDAAIYSNTIQIGNKVISTPLSFHDLIDAGAQLVSIGISEKKGNTEDYLLKPGEAESVNMSIGNTTIYVSMINNSAELCAIKDTDVKSASSFVGSDVIYPLGIKVGDTLSELMDKWGQPTEDKSKSYDKELTYTYLEHPISYKKLGIKNNDDVISATGCSYLVKIDRNTSRITYIGFVLVDKTQAADKTVRIVKEYSYKTNDVLELSFQIPYSIAQNMIKFILTPSHIGLSVYMFDDTPYVIVLDTPIPNDMSYRINSSMNTINDFTKEELSKIINSKYTIEAIEVNGSDKIAIGYLYHDNTVECLSVYMSEFNAFAISDCMLFPYDSNDIISEAATAKFKSIMLDYMRSFREKAIK
jgi:hypothetical protein